MVLRVYLNTVFTVKKGNRVMKWKVIVHPYFPDSLTLVRGYPGMRNGYRKEDDAHIGGCVTLDNAYDVAYDLT